MSLETYVWIGFVFLLAGYARGYSGFGFSAVAVAGLSFVVSPVVAVSTAIFLEVIASILQARSIWRHVDWRGSLILLMGGLIGNPLGVLILETAPQNWLKASVYLGLLSVAAILTFAKPRHVQLSTFVWFTIAVAAGIVNGSTALSGLFIVAIMTITAVPPARMRATLIAYFFFSDLFVAALLGWRGLLGSDVLQLTAFVFPFVIVGIFFGSRKFHESNEDQFRRATLVFLSLLSIAGLAALAVGVI